jgi:hypothetical protein
VKLAGTVTAFLALGIVSIALEVLFHIVIWIVWELLKAPMVVVPLVLVLPGVVVAGGVLQAVDVVTWGLLFEGWSVEVVLAQLFEL